MRVRGRAGEQSWADESCRPRDSDVFKKSWLGPKASTPQLAARRSYEKFTTAGDSSGSAGTS